MAGIKRKLSASGHQAVGHTDQTILDQYRDDYPSQQVGVNIFNGEWSSKFPDEYHIKAGGAQLFEDDRVKWLFSILGTLKDYDILELGPLEAGHTYMLDKTEACSVLAIEANTRAYLKCLIAKEVMNIKKAAFLCGDFRKYLETCDRQFDLVFCSGILYHMENPVKLISDISDHADRVFIWTHYFDKDVLQQKFPGKFDVERKDDIIDYKGFQCRLHKQYYQQALGWKGFCGGMKTFSYWLEKDAILECLRHFGFTSIDIYGDTLEHQNGPSFTILATKKKN